jgi:uncharacterized protein YjbI with pentapeptide repeats
VSEQVPTPASLSYVPADVYEQLERATPEERVEILLDELLERHASHRLELPKRNSDRAKLVGIDLSPQAIRRKYGQRLDNDPPTWWDRKDKEGRVRLRCADLRGADLRGAQLQNVDLYDAYLEGAELEDANLQGASLLMAHLQGANLRGAILCQANLGEAHFEGADLRDSRLEGVNLSMAASIRDIQLKGAHLDRTNIRQADLGERIHEEDQGKYEDARQVYLALKQNFSSLGEHAAARWAYLRERRMEKLESRRKGDWLKVLRDSFVEYLCDYGESIGRVLLWMAVLLLLVGPLVFYVLPMDWPDNVRSEYFSRSPPWRQLYGYFQVLIYTLDTFTTASFSELRPNSDLARLVSGVMALVGILLTGLLGFVVGNRIHRSSL